MSPKGVSASMDDVAPSPHAVESVNTMTRTQVE
jgi:hypothetical protein